MTLLLWIAVLSASFIIYGVGAGIAFHYAGYLFPNEDDSDEQFMRGLVSAFWPVSLPVLAGICTSMFVNHSLKSRAKRRAERLAATDPEIEAPKLPKARVVRNLTPYDYGRTR